MLFSLGHGQHIVQEDVPAARGQATAGTAAIDAAPIAAVAPGAVVKAPAPERELATTANGDRVAADASMVSTDGPALEAGKFRYFFPDAAGLPEQADMPQLLDALADSMVEESGAAVEQNSKIPPVFTYFGQFIDHDITANTDRDTEISIIDGAITPLPRSEVTENLVNLRDGSLALDSLYGDADGQGPFAQKLAELMRFPGNRAKMRLAIPSPIGGRPPLPADPDNATDLLRLGFLIKNGLITEAELKALTPASLRSVFIDADDKPILARAIIGDARNDENLIVAQLQVLFLRFHNKLADALGGRSFEKARRQTRWHYQWLVANSYLPTVCDPAIVAEVTEKEAPLYKAFFQAHGTNGPKMPMPLEFSLAAFRFGHSMIRGAYDHNRFFGEPVDGTPGIIPRASLDLLFGFTGDGRMNGDAENGQLPQNWVIEWERFLKTDPARPIRATRKIDTNLAAPLTELVNQPDGVFKHLARRNLRRSYRLNLPTAQDCIAALQGLGAAEFAVLTAEQLRSGSDARRDAVVAGGFDSKTPLWFYILKEAEVLGDGEHLGPLGSHLIANTLMGLIIYDEDSYWNEYGEHWTPTRFSPGNPIDSLEKVVSFCGML